MIFWSRSSKLKKYSQHKFTNVLIAILIIFIGLTPWLLSLWVRHNSTTQTRERIAAARLAVANRPLPTQLQTGDRTYIQAFGYPIGDLTCQYNARSNYLRHQPKRSL